MKKVIFSILVFSAGLLVSCNQEENFQADSIYKGEILDYISSYKNVVASNQIEKINDLASAINFKRVKIYQLRTTEKVIIADLKILNGFSQGDNMMKALFFVNQGKIVRSNIATFNSKTSSTEHDQLVLSVLNGGGMKSGYSGKVSLFNLYRELILFNSFQNGTLDAVGFTRRQKLGKNGGRSNSCTDWYLVTYYANGNVTKDYVFTTCDNGCSFYRMGRTNCGGGGDGGGASGGTVAGVELPANPVDGTTYEYTDKNGQYTKYKFNAAINTWGIVVVILPALVVEAKLDEYPFLDIDWPGAYHGQIVLGTDNFIYTFGSDGNWKGIQCIQNQLSNPCLSRTANNVLGYGLASNYNTIIQNIFNKSDKVNLTLKDDRSLATTVGGETPVPTRDGELINITIYLNSNVLGNSSEQYIASTIYHEAFHAIIHFLDSDKWFYQTIASVNEQHYMLFKTSLDRLATGLQAAFPSMSYSDAKGLMLKGLSGSGLSQAVKDRILLDSGLSANQISEISFKYSNLGTIGIRCN